MECGLRQKGLCSLVQFKKVLQEGSDRHAHSPRQAHQTLPSEVLRLPDTFRPLTTSPTHQKSLPRCLLFVLQADHPTQFRYYVNTCADPFPIGAPTANVFPSRDIPRWLDLPLDENLDHAFSSLPSQPTDKTTNCTTPFATRSPTFGKLLAPLPSSVTQSMPLPLNQNNSSWSFCKPSGLGYRWFAQTVSY